MLPDESIKHDQEFTKQFNECRKRLYLNTEVGKELDRWFSPMFKKYGYLDRKLVKLDSNTVPDYIKPYFLTQNDSVNGTLGRTGLDIRFYNKMTENKKELSAPLISDLLKLQHLYDKAHLAIVDCKKHFSVGFIGDIMWDLYGSLAWISKFDIALEEFKQKYLQEKNVYNESLIENIKYKTLKNPRINHLLEISENTNISKEYIKEMFIKIVGIDYNEYRKTVIEEGFNDFISSKLNSLSNQTIGKIGFGQSKNVANAKLNNAKAAETILTHWYNITQGKKDSATPKALKNFLINQIHVEPEIVNDILKKYNDDFKLTTQEYLNSRKRNPKLSLNDNLGESIINESYLPNNLLRKFFNDIVYAERSSVLRDTNKKPQSIVAPAPQTDNTTKQVTNYTPSQPEKQETNFKPIDSTPTSTPAPVAQAIPTINSKSKINPDDFKNAINNLPPNERAQAIIKSLPSLTDDEIRQVLTSLTTKK